MALVRTGSAPAFEMGQLPRSLAWGRFTRPDRSDRAWLVAPAVGRWSAAALAPALAGLGPVRLASVSAQTSAWRLSPEHWTSGLLQALGAASLADALDGGAPPPVVVLHLEDGPLEDLPEPTLLSLGAWISGPLCAALPKGGAGLRLVLPLGRGRLSEGHELAVRVLTGALNEAEHAGLGHLLPPGLGEVRAAQPGGGYRGAPRTP